MKENSHKDTDEQVKSDYDLIMNGASEIFSSKWEKVGENYKQFSLYEDNYVTRVSNSIESDTF